MKLKWLWQGLLWLSCCWAAFPLSVKASNPLGETVQIYINFHEVVGFPTWLLIIRDDMTGKILPYWYDMRQNRNFYIALTWAHTYRITYSRLMYDNEVFIDNFCQLENKRISGSTLLIRLSGRLTPQQRTSSCTVQQFKDLPFPMAG